MTDWAIAVACGAAIYAGYVHHNGGQFATGLFFLIVLIYNVAMWYGYRCGTADVERDFADAARSGQDLVALVKRKEQYRMRREAREKGE